MFGFDSFGGAGGFSGSSGATATGAPVSVGGFAFAPKSSTIPAAAWLALGAVALVLLLRKR